MLRSQITSFTCVEGQAWAASHTKSLQFEIENEWKERKKWFFRLTTLFIFLLVHLPSRLEREEETFNNFLFSCRFHVFTNPLNKKCCAPWLCREGNLNNHLRDAEYGFDAVSVVSCMRSSALYALKSFSYQCKFSSRLVLRSSNYSKAKKSVRSTPSPESADGGFAPQIFFRHDMPGSLRKRVNKSLSDGEKHKHVLVITRKFFYVHAREVGKEKD
jgi:hypothetical protein